MNMQKLLDNFKQNDKIILITFAEGFSMNCRILDIQSDFIKVNQYAFNKMEKTHTPTSNQYYIPFTSILLIEEPKN